MNNNLHSSPTQVPPSTNPSIAALLATRSMLNFGPFALAALAAAAAQQQQQQQRKDSYSSTPKSHSRSPSPSTWPTIPLTTPPSSSSSDRNNNANHEIEAGEIPTMTSPVRKRKRRTLPSNDPDNSLLSTSSSSTNTDLLDKQQLNMLRAHYALNPYPNANELHEISKRVGLSEQNVQHWFQVLRTSYASASNIKSSVNSFIPSTSTGGNPSNTNNSNAAAPFLPLAYYHLRASLMAAANTNSSIPPPPPLPFPTLSSNPPKEQTEPLDLTVKKSHHKSGEQQIAAHLHMTATVAFNNDTNWYENKTEWMKVSCLFFSRLLNIHSWIFRMNHLVLIVQRIIVHLKQVSYRMMNHLLSVVK